MSAQTIGNPPKDFRLGIVSGLAATAASTGVSPLEKIKLQFTFHPQDIDYDLRIPRSNKLMPIVKQNLPRCAARNIPFFTIYPFVKQQTDQRLPPVYSNVSSAAIAGFAQNAFFNPALKPSLSKGISGSIGWGSFFGITSALSKKNDSPIKTVSIGAIAGAASEMLQSTVQGGIKLSQFLPRAIRGSLTGASVFSAIAVANRYFGKKD